MTLQRLLSVLNLVGTHKMPNEANRLTKIPALESDVSSKNTDLALPHRSWSIHLPG